MALMGSMCAWTASSSRRTSRFAAKLPSPEPGPARYSATRDTAPAVPSFVPFHGLDCANLDNAERIRRRPMRNGCWQRVFFVRTLRRRI